MVLVCAVVDEKLSQSRQQQQPPPNRWCIRGKGVGGHGVCMFRREPGYKGVWPVAQGLHKLFAKNQIPALDSNRDPTLDPTLDPSLDVSLPL